jgi:hypothetical protein
MKQKKDNEAATFSEISLKRAAASLRLTSMLATHKLHSDLSLKQDG